MTGGTLLLCRRLAWKQGSRCLKMGATRHRQGGQPIQQLAGLGGRPCGLAASAMTCFTAITYGNQLRSAPAPEANAPAWDDQVEKPDRVTMKGSITDVWQKLPYYRAGLVVESPSSGRREHLYLLSGQSTAQAPKVMISVERMVMTRKFQASNGFRCWLRSGKQCLPRAVPRQIFKLAALPSRSEGCSFDINLWCLTTWRSDLEHPKPLGCQRLRLSGERWISCHRNVCYADAERLTKRGVGSKWCQGKEGSLASSSFSLNFKGEIFGTLRFTSSFFPQIPDFYSCSQHFPYFPSIFGHQNPSTPSHSSLLLPPRYRLPQNPTETPRILKPQRERLKWPGNDGENGGKMILLLMCWWQPEILRESTSWGRLWLKSEYYLRRISKHSTGGWPWDFWSINSSILWWSYHSWLEYFANFGNRKFTSFKCVHFPASYVSLQALYGSCKLVYKSCNWGYNPTLLTSSEHYQVGHQAGQKLVSYCDRRDGNNLGGSIEKLQMDIFSKERFYSTSGKVRGMILK